MFNKIPKILSVIVMIISAIVMIGWFFNIAVLKSILPQWVTMKFITALCFFFSGIILYTISQVKEGHAEWAQLTLSVSVLIVFLFMMTLLASFLIGIRTGIEDLFVRETAGAVHSSAPGMPSVGTMANFVLIASAGLITMLKIKEQIKYISITGWVIIVIGGIALLGYFIASPALYYSVEGMSSAMAVHTAILFVLTGIGFILLGMTNQAILKEKSEKSP